MTIPGSDDTGHMRTMLRAARRRWPGWLAGAAMGILGCAAQAQNPPPSTPGPSMDAQFAASWSQLAKPVPGWQMIVSPAFPQQWPPGRGGLLVRYAYAYRLPDQVADGSEVAAPWARGVGTPGGTWQVTPLRNGLEPIGIQGVRPLRQEELSLIVQQDAATAMLLQPLNAASEALIRAFYCNWSSRQGVIARQIEPLHPDFFRWLGCR